MRYPALSRVLAVFLAVVCLVTCAAGCLGFDKAKKDLREQQREEDLLQSRIDRAEELLAQLDALQPGYDEVIGDYASMMDQHKSAGSAYRMGLATYTATRAGLKIGRQQLDEAAAALEESLKQFMAGYYIFRDHQAAFEKIYNIYLTLRGSLDQGMAIYQQAEARMAAAGEDGEVEFTPEEILALAAIGHSTSTQVSGLLGSLKEDIPDDQHLVGYYVGEAVDGYNELSPELEGFSVEMLAYGVSQSLYEQAQATLDEQTAGGASDEDAHEAADEICQAAFGLSFDELGQWLQENEPDPASGEAVTIPPEVLSMLLEEMPSDQDLVDVAIGLIEDADSDLSAKEAAFREDPHNVGAGELFLAALLGSLDSAQRVLGLVEPTILSTKAQLDALQAQLEAAYAMLLEGKLQIENGYAELAKKAQELLDQIKEMRREKRRLQREKLLLDKDGDIIGEYDAVSEQFRSVRAELLSDDGIYARQQEGEDLLESSRAELALRIPAHREEYKWRLVMNALMLTGALFGVLAALGAFEKPKIKRLWLPLAAALLFSAAAETISFSLGRGLLYSSLFVAIFAAALLPLCIGGKKGDPA